MCFFAVVEMFNLKMSFQEESATNDFNVILQELVEDFIFPASKIVLQCRKSQGEFPAEQKVAVCSSPLTVIAAFDLLVALCTGCVHNLEFLAAMLIEMYYTSM